MEFEIRQAITEDVPAIEQLVAPPPRVVGLLVLEKKVDMLLLDNIALDPSAQGQGFGKALLVQAEHRARHLRKVTKTV